MRIAVLSLAALAALAASAAFDSETWLGKREVLSREADRLRDAYTNYQAKATTPAEAVTVTLERFPDGAVKTELFAREAVFFREEHFLWARGLTVRKFERDGSLVARIDAETCVVDQQAKSGWCPGHATITRTGSRFEGDGVYFSSPESYVTVYGNSDLRSRDAKLEALK